jgi:hypothetical protein
LKTFLAWEKSLYPGIEREMGLNKEEIGATGAQNKEGVWNGMLAILTKTSASRRL